MKIVKTKNGVEYVKFTDQEIMDLKHNAEFQEMLVQNCQQLVAKVAKTVALQGYDMDDKISIGNMGLFKAIQKWDINGGAEFYTYATTSIRNTLYNEAAKFKTQKAGYDEEEKQVQMVYSLDKVMEHKDGAGDSLVDYVQDDSVDVFYEGTANEGWNWMLEILTEREYQVICYSFKNDMTLEEIGNVFGSSKQAIRKSYVKAIDKLKKHSGFTLGALGL